MSVKRRAGLAAALACASLMTGCIAIYEGRDSVCPDADPNSDNWPYCGTATPGGSQPYERPDWDADGQDR